MEYIFCTFVEIPTNCMNEFAEIFRAFTIFLTALDYSGTWLVLLTLIKSILIPNKKSVITLQNICMLFCGFEVSEAEELETIEHGPWMKLFGNRFLKELEDNLTIPLEVVLDFIKGLKWLIYKESTNSIVNWNCLIVIKSQFKMSMNAETKTHLLYILSKLKYIPLEVFMSISNKLWEQNTGYIYYKNNNKTIFCLKRSHRRTHLTFRYRH